MNSSFSGDEIMQPWPAILAPMGTAGSQGRCCFLLRFLADNTQYFYFGEIKCLRERFNLRVTDQSRCLRIGGCLPFSPPLQCMEC